MSRLHTQRLLDAAFKVPEATLGGIALALFGLGHVLRPRTDNPSTLESIWTTFQRHD